MRRQTQNRLLLAAGLVAGAAIVAFVLFSSRPPNLTRMSTERLFALAHGLEPTYQGRRTGQSIFTTALHEVPLNLVAEGNVLLYPTGVSGPVPDEGAMARRAAETDKKLTALRTIIERHPGEQYAVTAGMFLGYALVDLARYDEAVDVLEHVTQQATAEFALPPETWFVLSQLYEATGRIDAAADVLRRAHAHRPDNVFVRGLDNLDNATRAGIITGRVTYNGRGVRGAHVLVHAPGTAYNVRSSLYNTRTTETGQFWLYGVFPGSYEIVMSLPPDAFVNGAHVYKQYNEPLVVTAGQTTTANVRLESPPAVTEARITAGDKHPILELQWELGTDTDNYGLEITVIEEGEGIGVTLADWAQYKTGDTSARVPLEHLFIVPETILMNISGFGTARGDMRFQPVFGVWAPTVEVKANFTPLRDTTNAVDSRPWLSIGSNRFRTTVAVDPHAYDFTPADRLLLRRNYVRAINAYERAWQNNPDDVHSLAMLAYVATHGVDEKGTHRDMQRAVQYIDRLVELGVSVP